MKLFSTSTLGFMLISAASTVYAAEPESQHNLQQTPFYFGLDVAYLYTKSDAKEIRNDLTAATGSTPSVNEDTSGAAGRIFAGYTLNPNFAFELAYIKTTKLKATITDNNIGYTANAKSDVRGVELSTLFSPTQLPNFFVKAGAVYSEIDSRIRGSGNISLSSSSVENKGWGYVAGFGYKYPVNDLLDIKATYAYYGKVGGESDADTHLLSLGFQYHY